MKHVSIYRKDTLLWKKVWLANSFFKKMIGLLSKSSLDSSEGMLFYKAPSIHTIGMKFPIDILFLDSANKVTRIFENIKPNRLLPFVKSTYTLELQANQSAEKQIKPDDVLRWEDGQVLVEYALIMAVFVLAMIIMYPLLAETVENVFQSVWDFIIDI